MASERSDVTFVAVAEQESVNMTIPGDASMSELLLSASAQLKELPHIAQLTELLVEAFANMGGVLYLKTCDSWLTAEERSAFKKLEEAVLKARSLAAKWKKNKLQVLLDKSAFVDEMSTTMTEIQNLFGRLQMRSMNRNSARDVMDKLTGVIEGLRDRDVSSELNLAETEFKKKLLGFLREYQSKSKTPEDATSIYTWLAKHLGSEVDSIRQELQEIKEYAAGSMLRAERNVDAELLEQLLLSLAVIEEKASVESTSLAEDIKAISTCGICASLMELPVTVDSGVSFCKSCIEEHFRRGNSTCPVTKMGISKYFVSNEALQNVIYRLVGLPMTTADDISLSSFGEADEHAAGAPSTEGGDISDANFDGFAIDEAPEKLQIELENLNSLAPPRVRTGFEYLIKCASMQGGPRAVVNAQYIPDPSAPPIRAIRTVLELARKHEYSRPAMKLLVVLTSDKGSGPDSEIILKVADGLDILVSLMKEKKINKTRLLAAEIVANILVNKQVRKTVRSCDGIVPALVSLSVDAARYRKDSKRAEAACLKGFQRLAKCSKRGNRTQIIVAALLNLLRTGLDQQPELTCLVRDSLVALESQVLKMDSGNLSKEVFKVIWNDMLELMEDEGFEDHATVPGRMAIISIMTKLCTLYKEEINESLFLYTLKMMRVTRTEINNLLALSPAIPQEGNAEKQLVDLQKLLGRSVSLLCDCVKHGKDTAQSILRENEEERNILEEMVHKENSGISDESRLEIQSILDLLKVERNPDTVVDGIKVLVKLSKSKDKTCRRQVASKLRMFVAENQHLTEFKVAGGTDALMTLLGDEIPNCQQDALIALHELGRSVKISVDKFEIILRFLYERWSIEVRNAAVGLLVLMITQKTVNADLFVKTEGALDAALNLLRIDPDSPGSEKCASALLEMAKEDESVRRRIAEPGLRGLDILVKYVRDHVKDPSRTRFEELLTATLVLFCRSGEACQMAVIRADGHVFLLACLRKKAQEKISKENAAQGLLELIKNSQTRENVLGAGFVTTAVRSTDARFACTDIALGLSLISSDTTGLNQIYLDPSSVSALLCLLGHCPDREGKDAAALVIGRLYPRLNCPEDLARQTKIANSCELFATCLDKFDMSHNKGILEALAAIAAETKGRIMFHETRGPHILIDKLSVSSIDDQGLILKILAEMSADVSEYGEETRDASRIRTAFLNFNIAYKLFGLFKSSEFNDKTEYVKYALVLIRNLSLSGLFVCQQLIELGAVTVLLEVLKRHETPLSVVTELAVKALEKFLDDPKGKQIFLRAGGIKSLAAVLNLNALGRTGDAKSVSTIILTAFAKDPHTRRTACETIFECDILSALNSIIFNGETSRIRWQAAVLMKLLAMYGPTSRVCSAMRTKGCLHALLALRSVQHCNEMANDVLKFVSEKSKDCRREIDAAIAQGDS